MRLNFQSSPATMFAAVVTAAGVSLACFDAQAGGFSIREQSTSNMGASFAGNAAGLDLSTMYWNPAAVTVKDGVNSESHAAVIFPDSELTATGGSLLFLDGDANSGQIGNDALVTSSYYNMQIQNYDPNLYFGLALNSPFGLVTEAENSNWAGSTLGRTGKIFNVTLNPIVGYKVAPGLSIAAGAQAGYLEATFKFSTGVNAPNTFYKGDDIAFGFTAGVLWEPMKGTKIGVGYRSEIEYELEGKLGDNVLPAVSNADVDLTVPAIVTASIRQDITDRLRLLGTFEWTDWSEFDQLDIFVKGDGALASTGPFSSGENVLSLEANWDDSWFVSGGLEFDYSKKLTLRAGVGYEEAPIDRPDQRLTLVPDNDRIWLSGGATYKWNDQMTIDVAYTHIFIEDSEFDRESLVSSDLDLQGNVDSQVDIIAVSLKTKLGGGPPPLK